MESHHKLSFKMHSKHSRHNYVHFAVQKFEQFKKLEQITKHFNLEKYLKKLSRTEAKVDQKKKKKKNINYSFVHNSDNFYIKISVFQLAFQEGRVPLIITGNFPCI